MKYFSHARFSSLLSLHFVFLTHKKNSCSGIFFPSPSSSLLYFGIYSIFYFFFFLSVRYLRSIEGFLWCVVCVCVWWVFSRKALDDVQRTKNKLFYAIQHNMWNHRHIKSIATATVTVTTVAGSIFYLQMYRRLRCKLTKKCCTQLIDSSQSYFQVHKMNADLCPFSMRMFVFVCAVLRLSHSRSVNTKKKRFLFSRQDEHKVRLSDAKCTRPKNIQSKETLCWTWVYVSVRVYSVYRSTENAVLCICWHDVWMQGLMMVSAHTHNKNSLFFFLILRHFGLLLRRSSN